MSFKVRAANPNDAKILAELGAETFYYTFRPFNTEEDMQSYIKKAYSEEVISQNLQDASIRYAVAFDGTQAIGYTKLLLNGTHEKLSGKCVELEKIYVLQTTLGKGAGLVLMNEVIEYCKQQQTAHLFLGVWEENDRAVNFYRKIGFEVFTSRSFQLGSRWCEDYMMKLDI